MNKIIQKIKRFMVLFFHFFVDILCEFICYDEIEKETLGNLLKLRFQKEELMKYISSNENVCSFCSFRYNCFSEEKVRRFNPEKCAKGIIETLEYNDGKRNEEKI